MTTSRWNAARCFANLLDDRWDDLCVGRRVLELGAGGGLPSLICALNGAETVSTLPALSSKPQINKSFSFSFCNSAFCYAGGVDRLSRSRPPIQSCRECTIEFGPANCSACQSRGKPISKLSSSREASSDAGLGSYMGIVYCFISTKRTVRPHHIE